MPSVVFGHFAIGITGYAGVGLIMLAIAALTALTSHMTVVAYLSDIDIRQPDGG